MIFLQIAISMENIPGHDTKLAFVQTRRKTRERENCEKNEERINDSGNLLSSLARKKIVFFCMNFPSDPI